MGFETLFLMPGLHYSLWLSILVFWVWALKPEMNKTGKKICKTFNPRFLSMGFETDYMAVALDVTIDFQSSFSEYGLWNQWEVAYRGYCVISFNPRFLSMGFETRRPVYYFWEVSPFNPRFLSMGFETYFQKLFLRTHKVFQSSFSEYGLWNSTLQSGTLQKRWNFQSSFSEYGLWNCQIFSSRAGAHLLSILVFWVWALKHDTLLSVRIVYSLSILVFWVWALKQVMLWKDVVDVVSFNPRFLSMGFETFC